MDPLNNIPDLDPSQNDHGFWKRLEDFALAGISAATGDPEAVKTIVEVLANAIHLALIRIHIADESKMEIKDKIQEGIDAGADGLIKILSFYQQKAASANKNLRNQYGRHYERGQ